MKMGLLFPLSPPQPPPFLNTLQAALVPSETQHVDSRKRGCCHPGLASQPGRLPLTPLLPGLPVRSSKLHPDWLGCFDFRASEKGLFVNRDSGSLASPPLSSSFYPNPGSDKLLPQPRSRSWPWITTPLPLTMPWPRSGRFHPQTQALLVHHSARPSAVHPHWRRVSWHSGSPRSAEGGGVEWTSRDWGQRLEPR